MTNDTKRDRFFREVDSMIIAGVSNPKVALHFSIGETTVRRRKQELRFAGILAPHLQAAVPEAHNANRNR